MKKPTTKKKESAAGRDERHAAFARDLQREEFLRMARVDLENIQDPSLLALIGLLISRLYFYEKWVRGAAAERKARKGGRS